MSNTSTKVGGPPNSCRQTFSPRQRLTALTDCVVQQQIQEMEAIRHTVMTLEANHTTMKQKSVSLWPARSKNS